MRKRGVADFRKQEEIVATSDAEGVVWVVI